jgi:hypothetical protein
MEQAMNVYLVIGEHGSYSGYLNQVVYATTNKEEAHSEADSRMKVLNDYRQEHIDWAKGVADINKSRAKALGFEKPRDFLHSYTGRPYSDYTEARDRFIEESEKIALMNGLKKPSDGAPEVLRLDDYDYNHDIYHNFFVIKVKLDRTCHLDLYSGEAYPTYFLESMRGEDERWYDI